MEEQTILINDDTYMALIDACGPELRVSSALRLIHDIPYSRLPFVHYSREGVFYKYTFSNNPKGKDK